jgi:hypothetical protein
MKALRWIFEHIAILVILTLIGEAIYFFILSNSGNSYLNVYDPSIAFFLGIWNLLILVVWITRLIQKEREG